MIPRLAMLEAVAIFAAVCGTIVLWGTPLLTHWSDVALVLAKALAIALCWAVSFYYNDLYDLRIVRTFADFAPRLVQAFGVTFILLAVLYALLPDVKISSEPFLVSVLAVPAILLPLRAICHLVVRGKSFQEHILILGTTPLASTLIREITNRPELGYAILGVADSASAPAGFPLPETALKPLERLGQILEELRPHRAIVALAERRARLPVRQLLEARMRGCVVEDGVNVYERLMGKLAIDRNKHEQDRPLDLLRRLQEVASRPGHRPHHQPGRVVRRHDPAVAAARAHRAADQAEFARSGVLRPGAGRHGREALSVDQIPHDASGRRSDIGVGL